MLRHERREEDVIRRTKSYRLDQGEYHGQRSCMTPLEGNGKGERMILVLRIILYAGELH